MRTCSVEGCENKHYCKGYCSKHYMQIRRTGQILDIRDRKESGKNEIIEYEDYAELILYDKYHNEVARSIIDLEYIDVINNYKWRFQAGYVFNNKIGLLHRFIMNPPEDMVIDHINRNPLDNRRDNLRICTQQENQFNRSVQCNNTSGVTGVCFYKSNNKWIAYIKVDKKKKYLGCYSTKEEAIAARHKAEIEYFGEFTPSN